MITKNLMATIIVVLGLMMCCYGCDNHTIVIEPVPNSSFVNGVIVDPQSPENVCVVIAQKTLWQFGDEATALRERIVSNTKLLVDGTIIKDVYNMSFAGIHSVIQNDKVVGTYGDDLNICFGTKSFSKGEHLVNLSIKIGQTLNSYTWKFRIS
jgi:hypothetical protein